MFRYSFNMLEEAKLIEEAVRKTLEFGIRTSDIGGKSHTNEVGDAIVSYLLNNTK
jgi:3-isopropylmalate dehydrogenase